MSSHLIHVYCSIILYRVFASVFLCKLHIKSVQLPLNIKLPDVIASVTFQLVKAYRELWALKFVLLTILLIESSPQIFAHCLVQQLNFLFNIFNFTLL